MQKPKTFEIIYQNEYKFLMSNYTDPVNKNIYADKTYHFTINDLYCQYGINDKLAVGFQSKWYNYYSYDQDSTYPSNDQAYNFFDANAQYQHEEYQAQENFPYATKFFMQTPLWQNNYFIVSAQPNISVYQRELYRSAGLSLLYGSQFQIGTKKGFVSFEAGFDQSYSTATHFDATIGYSITSRNMIMLQSFNFYNTKFYHDYLCDEQYYANDIRLILIHKYNKYFSIQTGYGANVTQRNNYLSHSVISGFLLKF